MEIYFAKVEQSSKHLSTQSMIGVRPINYVKRARGGTINNVNSQVHKIGARIYSDTPQTEQSCVGEGLVCCVGATAQHCCLRGAWATKQKRVKTEECDRVVMEAEQCVTEQNGEMGFQRWWSRGEGVKDERSSVSCWIWPEDDWDMLVLSLPLCCSVNLPTRSLWIMRNDFEMQLWCSPSDAGDYEGISERVAGRLVGGWGGNSPSISPPCCSWWRSTEPYWRSFLRSESRDVSGQLRKHLQAG